MNYVSFSRSATRSSGTKNFATKLLIIVYFSNSYFYRLPKLLNAFLEIDLANYLNATKKKLKTYLWNHFVHKFDPNNNCTLHFVCSCYNFSCHPFTPNFSTL